MIWGLLGHQLTFHYSPFPVCQNSATAVANLITGRFFGTSPYGARTTIEEIILNLNVWGEEERKRIVLASSRKRADIL